MNFSAIRSPQTLFSVTLVSLLGVSALSGQSAQSIQLADGTVYFAQPPTLIDASTTFDGARSGSTYFFTLNLPETAGVPLQQITLTQQSGGETLHYNLNSAKAFEGTRDHEGQTLSVGNVTLNKDTRTLRVSFDPPVAPGKTVTLSLRPQQNPGIPGYYLVGVTAYPQGEKPYGQFLGFARLRFKHKL